MWGPDRGDFWLYEERRFRRRAKKEENNFKAYGNDRKAVIKGNKRYAWHDRYIREKERGGQLRFVSRKSGLDDLSEDEVTEDEKECANESRSVWERLEEDRSSEDPFDHVEDAWERERRGWEGRDEEGDDEADLEEGEVPEDELVKD